MEVVTEQPEGVPLGRYLLGQRVATGGMGEVYLGVQRGLADFEKPLALKLLLPHLSRDPEAVEMFLHEARLAARMNHPNVVQILDVGIESGRYYIAMELVRGVSLAALIRRLSEKGKSVSPALVTYIAHGLCDGLQYAHELSDKEGKSLEIVHRDVSPQNVLVSMEGGVKLADFGIAKARNTAKLTAAGKVKGKLAYMAPEQFEDLAADQRSDVYSAALTVFELASLRSPFDRESEAATMRAVLQSPLPDLEALRPDLPRDVVGAVAAACARDRTQRLPTARAFRNAMPPLYDSFAPSALGELLRDVCREAIEDLEARTQLALKAGRTQTASAFTPPEANSRRSRPRRWATLTLAIAGSVLASAGVAWVVSRSGAAPASEAPPVAPPSPAPVAAAVADPPRPPAADPSPTPRPPAAPHAPAARPKPPPAAKTHAMGYLTVDAKPWATVFIHGTKIGDTPIYGFPVETGELSVLLKNPDTGKSVTRKVRIVPAQQAYLKADLE